MCHIKGQNPDVNLKSCALLSFIKKNNAIIILVVRLFYKFAFEFIREIVNAIK